ncbi:MAG: DMT family transporter [Burkholderiaceae bacterium]|nr:DMT family transporter [Burkholderiaceae bacterium]
MNRAVFSVPVLALCWGLNWPAVKIALAEVAPWTLRTIGLGSGALVLFAFAIVRGRSLAAPRGQRLPLALAGLLTVAAFNVLVAFAQLSGSTSRAAIVTFSMPVWAILLAWPLLGERPDARRSVSLALGVAGLALLGAPLARAQGVPAGVWFALAAGACWAAGTIVTKRWPVAASPITVAAWQLLVGALAAGVGMLWFEGVPVPKRLSTDAMLALAFHIVLAQALAYFLWFEVISRLPAGIAALGTLLVPVVGVSGAMTLLGERPSGFDLAGFVLITAAAALALLPRRRIRLRPPARRPA